MQEALFVKMRECERFRVNLAAQYSVQEAAGQMQECRLTNLSASGAAVRFPRTENLTKDKTLQLEIRIPNTILHFATAADIVWVRHQFRELACGVRFRNLISAALLQRLTGPNDNGPA